MIGNPEYKTWLTRACDNKHRTLSLEDNNTKCKRKTLNIVNLYSYTMSCTTKHNLNLKQNQHVLN
jgi:hypothetical protein